MSRTQKNVVLLTIDTLRKDAVGCYGSEESYTPFIDSIQGKSIRFNRCMSVGPYTQASFPGLLTSTYYFEFGREKMLSPKRMLVSQVVKNGGFSTAGFHSNPYLSDYFGWNRGWDTFYDSMMDDVTDMYPYILGDKINAKVDAWLGNQIQGDYRPFFLWAHYMDVHEPYIPNETTIAQVDPGIRLSKDEMFNLFKDVVLPRNASDPETNILLKKLYQAHVLEVDAYAKTFFGILEKHGILDDTIVIITSDHGDEFGEHGSLSHDGKMYNELINVPLMIYDPDLTEGKVSDALVSGVDVPTTIAHVFGLDVPESHHGQSLLPLDRVENRPIMGESIGKLQHKVRETDRSVTFYQEENVRISYRAEDERWEMYDLAADPEEKKNIIEAASSSKEMKEKLLERMHSVSFENKE